MVLVLLMIPAALLDKHRERHAPAYFLIGTILTIAAEVLYVSAWNVPNFMMYAANVLALLCFFIAHRERAETLRRFAFLFWLPCMIYSGLIIWRPTRDSMRFFLLRPAQCRAVLR